MNSTLLRTFEVHVASDAQSDCVACHGICVDRAGAKAIFFTNDVFSDFFDFFRCGDSADARFLHRLDS